MAARLRYYNSGGVRRFRPNRQLSQADAVRGAAAGQLGARPALRPPRPHRLEAMLADPRLILTTFAIPSNWGVGAEADAP
jgi:hypothetical protein